MENKDYLQDLKDIKDLMSKSTQFLSLSGLSGVLAGFYALIGAVYVKQLLLENSTNYPTLEKEIFLKIVFTALLVLISSLVTAYVMTVRKAKKMGEKVWNTSSKRLLANFSIPLVTGGILTLLLLQKGYYELIAPMTLLFYGLACVNASKYTLRDVRYLGITEIILGLLAVELSEYALYFWIIGFGICHIVYGAMMYFKYDRK